MLSKVIIVHGWADNPAKGWISWLVEQLTAKGYQAIAPKMPNPYRPSQKKWLAKLNKVIGKNLENTILIGHSLGCFVLLRFLEQDNLIGKLDKLIFVAGFIKPKDPAYEQYFLPTPDFNKIKSNVKNIFCVYSDNDRSVSYEQTKRLSNKLKAKLILDKNKEHFSARRGVVELPSVLGLILDK